MNLKVVCVKWGSKYSSDYVNRLHNMVKRNLTLPHRFICLTDNANGLHPDIETIRLSDGFKRQWNKIELFKPGMFSEEDLCLYLDLDIVIVGNLDDLILFKPEEIFLSVYDWNQRIPQYNSSVMRFYGNSLTTIYDSLVSKLLSGKAKWLWRRRGCNLFARRILSANEEIFIGDQIWISHCLFPPEELKRHTYPLNWILSYKTHGRNSLPTGCKIMVFHGLPNPHEVDNDYVKENWR